MYVLHKTGTVAKRKRSQSVSAATYKRIKGSIMKQALTSSRRLGGARMGTGPVAAAARGNPLYGREIKTLETQLVSAGGSLFNPISATLNTSDSAVCLNLIQQGTADYNRVGKSVNMKSLRVRGYITNVFTLPVISNSAYNQKIIRMVIVHIKSDVGAIPTFNAIFGGLDQSANVVTGLDSAVLPYQLHDVTILRDKTFKVTSDNGMLGTGDTNGNRLPFDEYINLKGLQTVYRGTSAPLTIASIQTGAIIMYIRAGYAASNDIAAIQESGVARLRYEDN